MWTIRSITIPHNKLENVSKKVNILHINEMVFNIICLDAAITANDEILERSLIRDDSNGIQKGVVANCDSFLAVVKTVELK